MSRPGTTEFLARDSQGKVWLRAGADRQKTALWVQGILLAPSTPMSSLMLPPGLGTGLQPRARAQLEAGGLRGRDPRHRRRGRGQGVYICVYSHQEA